MVNYERIKKDCFWDYNFTNKDIELLAISKSEREKTFLFQKILLNSTKMFHDLKIFDNNNLKNLIENYKIPKFNYEYAFKRKNMAEAYFLGKPILVNELQWVS